MLAMNVFERTEYEIRKTKAHLTAGANRRVSVRVRICPCSSPGLHLLSWEFRCDQSNVYGTYALTPSHELAHASMHAYTHSLYGSTKVYNSMRPQQVAALANLGIREIVSGQDHLIAVDCVHRLRAWGRFVLDTFLYT